jgi:hypothetical protein
VLRFATIPQGEFATLKRPDADVGHQGVEPPTLYDLTAVLDEVGQWIAEQVQRQDGRFV